MSKHKSLVDNIIKDVEAEIVGRNEEIQKGHISKDKWFKYNQKLDRDIKQIKGKQKKRWI